MKTSLPIFAHSKSSKDQHRGSLKPCFQCINRALSARSTMNIIHAAFEFEDLICAENNS